MSTSKTTQTGGSWVETMPTWVNGKYLWTRDKIVYTNPASTKYTTPIVSSEWEAVNEIEIGASNLLVLSNLELGSLNPIDQDAGSNYRLRLKSTKHIQVEGGETYAITPFEAEDFIGFRCGIHTIDSEGNPVRDSGWLQLEKGKPRYYTMPTNAAKMRPVFSFSKTSTNVTTGGTESTTKIDLANVINYKIKIEKGNIGTDWTPAPEDTIYDRTRYNNDIKAAAAITADRLIVGTSAGYVTAAAGISFDINYPVLWCQTAFTGAGNTQSDNYITIPSKDLRNNKSGITLTQHKMAYLKGTLSGNIFTIDTAVFSNEPTTEDGKYYIPIGILYSTYQVYFDCGMPTVYKYYDGAFRPLPRA